MKGTKTKQEDPKPRPAVFLAAGADIITTSAFAVLPPFSSSFTRTRITKMSAAAVASTATRTAIKGAKHWPHTTPAFTVSCYRAESSHPAELFFSGKIHHGCQEQHGLDFCLVWCVILVAVVVAAVAAVLVVVVRSLCVRIGDAQIRFMKKIRNRIAFWFMRFLVLLRTTRHKRP